MKRLLLVVLVALLALEVPATSPPAPAPSPPPSIDQILADDQLVQKYFECLVDKAPCSPGANQFKSILGDALTTGCASCTAQQKASSEKVIKFAVDKKPELFHLVEQKYDPAGAYRTRTTTVHH